MQSRSTGAEKKPEGVKHVGVDNEAGKDSLMTAFNLTSRSLERAGLAWAGSTLT